jgi:hypothetical protein
VATELKVAVESDKIDENFDFLGEQVSSRLPSRQTGGTSAQPDVSVFLAAFLFGRLAAVLRHFKGD